MNKTVKALGGAAALSTLALAGFQLSSADAGTSQLSANQSSTTISSTSATLSNCAKAQGKFSGHLVTSYKLTSKGGQGGTLQVFASDPCQTIWAKTVKLQKYSTQPYVTIADISYLNPQHKKIESRTEGVTAFDAETPAMHNPNLHAGKFHVEGGFTGSRRFYSVHTYQY